CAIVAIANLADAAHQPLPEALTLTSPIAPHNTASPLCHVDIAIRATRERLGTSDVVDTGWGS
ncbi:hypothetical protein EI555_012616, partial [Monodon monoceros]